MKAQSFENQLRHAVAPAPDPEARLRARRAAVAEFERVHVQSDAVGTVAPTASPNAAPTARKGFLGFLPFFRDGQKPAREGWASRNTLLGGFASACVVVVGASVLWLMPAEQRQISLHRSAVSETPTEVQHTLEAEQRGTSPPATPSTGETSAPVSTGEIASTSATTSSAEATSTPGATPTVQAEGSITTQSTTASERKDELGNAQSPVAGVARSSKRAAEDPMPPNAAGPPNQAEPAAVMDEVIVDATRTQRREMESASPIVALESTVTDVTDRPVPRAPPPPSQPKASDSGSLEEVQIAGSRRLSRVREFFSRKASANEAPVVEPPAEGRDKFQHFDLNAVKRVADDAVSTFSVDVDTASYSFVRRQLNRGVLPQVDAVRVEEMINYFDYAWPVPESRDQPFKPTVTVSDSPWGEGKKLIHIGIKGYALPTRQQPDVNLVLLLDVSGSMNSPDKLPLAQQSMALLLDSLKPTDTVAIVVYAGAAGEVLAPTPVSEKDTILRALNSLRPGGSTAGAAGIRLAYELAERSFRKGGVNRILLATDGDFNVGITNQNELKGFVEREREKGVNLSVLGFGEGNYRDEMAQALAQNGNGVAAYIDTLAEAKKVLVQQSTGSLFTIAKDVKLQVEFNPATVAEYRLVGYETRALNREDFNNDKVDAGDVGSGHTVTAIYEITPVGSNSKLVDESRYAGREQSSDDRKGKANEYGFLKIRYKLPNGMRSKLLEQPIRVDAGVPASLEADVDFSTAVAGFGQLLRGGKYTGSLGFEDVIRQAQGALDKDQHEYRAEFVQLVRKAQEARGM